MMRSKLTLLILSLTMIIFTNAYSQGISISETNSAPDPSAMLDVSSTTKGLLPPRLTSSQRIAMPDPASGLVVYDTDFNALFVMTGEGWMRVDYGDKWQKDEDNNLTYNQGNVGIGVSYPGAALEVNGQVKINGGSPGAGKVLTSDAAGMAAWMNAPMSILGTGNSSGFTNLTTGLSFMVAPVTIELSESARILIHSSRALGTTTGINSSGTINLYLCYRNTNGGSLVSIGGGMLGLRIPANTRVPFSLSYSTTLLPAGIYEVGLCGTCSDPLQWNSNEYSYTSAMAYKLPSGTTGLSVNMQESTDVGLSRNLTEADQSSEAKGNQVDPVAGNESSKEQNDMSIKEKIEQLSRENESIKNQLDELTKSIESGSPAPTDE